jgi:Putative Actinobacterial Holin-X, holin superfamily III
MAIRESTQPLTSVIQRAASEVSYLIQTELRLARTEVSDKLGQVANGGVQVGIGAVMALAGLIIFLLAIVRWLEVAGLPSEWGFLLVGGGVVLLGIVLLLRGTRSMKGSNLVPQRTLDQLKADLSAIQE